MVTTHRLDRHHVGEPQRSALSLKRWTALCAAAEAVGMTAAARRIVEFPVQYAATHDGAAIVPARPETKQWWRNLLEPAPVDALVRGEWRHAEARVLQPGDAGHDDAVTLYRRRWPRARLADDALVVVARFVPASGTAGHKARRRAGRVAAKRRPRR